MLRRDEVFDNIRWLEVNFPQTAPGKHTLKLIMIDPEIVIEQIVVNPDNNHYSYFGPWRLQGVLPDDESIRLSKKMCR